MLSSITLIDPLERHPHLWYENIPAAVHASSVTKSDSASTLPTRQVESNMWSKRFSFDRCFCDEDADGDGDGDSPLEGCTGQEEVIHDYCRITYSLYKAVVHPLLQY